MLQFPSIPAGEPLSISASLYVTYLRCPRQAMAQVLGRYGPESRAAFSGMLAHRIFARHLTSGRIPDTEFTDACRQEIGQAMNPKLGSLQLRPSELRGVISEVAELYQRFQARSADGCRSVETELVAAVSADVTLRGRIDAVFDDDRGVRLVDWKTGNLGAADQQLGFYALLWGLCRGELPATVEAVSVGNGERSVFAPSVADASATARQLVEMINTLREGFVESDEVPAKGGPGCRHCPLAEECAEGIAALRILTA